MKTNRLTPQNTRAFRQGLSLVLSLLMVLLISGCEFFGPYQPPATPFPTPGPTRTPQPTSPVSVRVRVPNNTPLGSAVQLVVPDMVTGASQAYELLPGPDFLYTGSLDLPDGALLHYFYQRVSGGVRAVEVGQNGARINNRVYHTSGGRTIEDVVAAWQEQPATYAAASLSGVVRDQLTGAPVGGVLISAGGQMAVSDWQGSYTLGPLPAGPTQVVAYTWDGRWRTMARNVTLNPDFNGLDINVLAARVVSVGFIVYPPAGVIGGAELRLAGNVYQLGSTWQVQPGGSQVLTDRQPVFRRLDDGRLLAVVSMFEGQYVRYRYTFGDGRFNGELNPDGGPQVREFVVPGQDVTLQEQLGSFIPTNLGQVTFLVNTPPDTPPGAQVHMQLFVNGLWQPALPMWRLGANSFTYILYNPLNFAGDVGYRFCYSANCNATAEAGHAGSGAAGYRFQVSGTPQTQVQTLGGWQQWAGIQPAPEGLAPVPDNPRPWMTAGVGLPTADSVRYQSTLPQTLNDIRALGANTVRIAVVWEVTNQGQIRPNPDFSPLREDVVTQVRAAQQAGLRVALYPQIMPAPDGVFGGDMAAFWAAAAPQVSGVWWDNWFNEYRRFLLSHAALAQQLGVDYFYVGSYALGPALPGEPPVPAPSADGRWRALIDETRTVFNRALVFQLQAGSFGVRPQVLDYAEFVQVLDVQWEVPLSQDADPTLEALRAVGDERMAVLLTPLLRDYRQVWVALRYAAADRNASQCVALQGGCAPLSRLTPDLPPNAGVPVDLAEQALVYAAMLQTIEQFNQIEGVFTEQYALPIGMQDVGLSVRNKPAEGILRAWFLMWLGP